VVEGSAFGRDVKRRNLYVEQGRIVPPILRLQNAEIKMARLKIFCQFKERAGGLAAKFSE
jgi:hypothetical protein